MKSKKKNIKKTILLLKSIKKDKSTNITIQTTFEVEKDLQGLSFINGNFTTTITINKK